MRTDTRPCLAKSPMLNVTVRFGDYELSLERLELRRGDKIVGMEPQVFDVLSYLLRHRDRVVSKSELLDNVWGDRFVSDVAEKTHPAGPSHGSAPRQGRAAPAAMGPAGRVLRAIHDITDGVGAAIQVSGGAGSGKTELLDQVAEAARRQSLVVGLSGPAV